MAAGAAAGLDPHLARRKIKLVIHDSQPSGRQLVETQDFADGLTGPVHEGLRFDQQYLFAADFSFGNLGVEFAGPRRK